MVAETELIEDDDILLRRIPDFQVTPSPADPPWRVSSQDWDDPHKGAPSVYCERLLLELGLDWRDVLDGYPAHSLAVIYAGQVRHIWDDSDAGFSLDVMHRPDPNDSHPRAQAHCEITGLPATSHQRKKAKKPLARQSRLVVVKTDSRRPTALTWAEPGYEI